MSSIDIEIVSLPNLQKIENFINDSSYRETLEVSANFNTRLCMERKSRMPFLDPQTGVAQTSCHLYANRRQRMPGFREGQIYSYPSQRWYKPKRQYLQREQNMRPFRNLKGIGDISQDGINQKEQEAVPVSLQDDSSSLGPMGFEGDISKDGISKGSDELPKDWFYDEMEIHDIDDPEDLEQADSDFEYNINGYRRKTGGARRRSKPAGSKRSRDSNASGDGTPKRSRGGSSTGSRRRRKPAGTPKKPDPDIEVDKYTPAFEPSSFDSSSSSFMRDGENGELRNYRKTLWSDHC